MFILLRYAWNSEPWSEEVGDWTAKPEKPKKPKPKGSLALKSLNSFPPAALVE